MTLFSPYMTRGRDSLYLSTVHNNDISTRAQMTALNAAIAQAGVKHVIFDRGYNVTFTRDANTALFSCPLDGRKFHGSHDRPIDLSPLASTGVADTDRKYVFSLSGTEGTTSTITTDLPKGVGTVILGAGVPAARGFVIGDPVRIWSEKTFILGGTKMTFLEEPTGLFDAVAVGDTITQGGASATVAGRYPAPGTSANYAGFILSSITGTFTAAADVFEGANNLGTPTGVFNGVTDTTEKQGEVAMVVGISADRIEVWPPVQDTYLVADGAKITKLAMVQAPEFEGIRAIGPGQLLDGGAAAIRGDRMFNITLADKLVVDQCIGEYLDNGNFFYTCTDGRVTGNRFVFDITSDAATRNCISYGIGLINACQAFDVSYNHVIGGKHCIVQSEFDGVWGVTRDVEVQHNYCTGSWNFGIAAHTNGARFNVNWNTLVHCSGGVEAGCKGFSSSNNTILGMQFVGAELGAGFAITEVCEDVKSSHDRVEGGGWGMRFQSDLSPGMVSPDVGIRRVHVDNFMSESANQAAIRFWWRNLGDRDDLTFRAITTRDCGQPVDGNGNPTTGAATAAPSIDIRGTANGQLTGVVIDGADLRGWAGNTTPAVFMEYTDALVSNVSYSEHAAPSINGGTATLQPDGSSTWSGVGAVTTSNVRAA